MKCLLPLLAVVLPTLAARADFTLTPTADTYAQDADSTTDLSGTNFGNAASLFIKTSGASNFNRDSYLKFDLSSVGTIVSAKLRIHAQLSSAGSQTVSAYPVSDTTWGETTLTWNNRPALGSALSSVSVNITTAGWFEWDVTSHASAEKAAGRNVISLGLHCPPASALLITAGSRTSSFSPELVVTSLAPGVSLDAASGVTAISATISGTVNPNALATTAQFEYGTTTSYGSTASVTLSPNNGTSALPVSANLGGLLPNTTYHFRLTATSGAGTSTTADGTFATPVAPPPGLTVAAASGVTATGATLSGTVNPNGYSTTAKFEYGPTTGYGSPAAVRLSPGNGFSAQAVSAILRDLQPGLTYHFRLTATNIGGTVNTTDGSFTTSGAAPSVTITSASGVTSTAATLNGQVNPNGFATMAQFEYGNSTAYGSTAGVTLSPGDGTSAQNVSASLGSLSAGATYHYRLTATNSGGTCSTADATFTAGAPIVTISAATGITGSAATLNATVNPNGFATTAQFEYGSTTSFGNTASVPLSPNNGTSAQTVSAALSGLISGEIYHFRFVATNANGTSTSATLSFVMSPRGVVAELGGGAIEFSPLPRGSVSGSADRMPVLRQLNAGGVRIAGVFPSMCWNGTTADASICDTVVLMAHAQGVQPDLLINFYESPSVPGTFGTVGEPDAEVREIARAFAERFHPNSAWLISQGIQNWGIQVYSAINEPDISLVIPTTGAPNYATTMEAFADGVHSVDARLRVVNGAFGSMYQHDYTCHGYATAIAHLFNNGKLDGMMLHTYNAITVSPIVKSDGTVTFGDSCQAYFDSVKAASGVTRDINFYADEFNFKSNIPDVTEDLAAKRFLTCLWASFGVVRADGTRASKLSFPWNIFYTPTSDPEGKFYMCTQLTPTWIPNQKGATLAMAANLMSGMHFVSLYPKGTGVFTLNGNGRKMWVWQNYPNWSSIQGTSFSITDIPSGATQLDVYGWDGLRQTVPLSGGQTSATITNQPMQETLMFVANASDPDAAILVQNAAGATLFSGISTVDFAKSGESGVARAFTITNNGTGNLTGLATSVDGSDFVAGAPGSATLAPGESTTFSVMLNSCFGARNGTVHIASNDPNTPRFDLGVAGIGNQANLGPTAVDDAVSVNEATATMIDVAANDADPDAGPIPLAALSVTQPAHGTAVVSNGQIVYTPNAGYYGAQDAFSYTVSDGDLTSTANVTVMVVAAPVGNVEFTPTADTYAQDGSSANSNFGGLATLLCKDDGGSGFERDAYLKFDVSSLATVVSARLRIHAMLSAGGTVSMGVHALSNTSWGETTLTWNLRPALDALLATGNVTGTLGQWFEFDVTDYLASERAAGHNVVSLGLHYASTSSLLATIGSRESSSAPQLVVASLRPGVSLAAASAVTASGATLNGTANPNGYATVAQFEYGLTTSYGGTAAVTLSPNNGASAQNVSASISGLTPATTYHYRLVASSALGIALTADAMVTTPPDTTPPTIGGSFSPVLIVTGAGGTVALPDYTSQAVTSDDVGVTSVTQAPAPGTVQSAGVSHVILTAQDAAGNTSNRSFDVLVVSAQQSWMLQYFGTTSNTGNAADAATPDGDGIANLIKYALVIAPGSSAAGSLPAAELRSYAEGRRLSLTLTRDPGRHDITISVEAGGAPSGPWSTVASSVNGAAFTGAGFVSETNAGGGLKIVEVRDTVNLGSALRRFMRIEVTH